MTIAPSFSPGDIVRARGREWVVSGIDTTQLLLRPLSGGEEDAQLLDLEIEPNIAPARFEPPTAVRFATQDGARLLSEALRLGMRRGAGPFRSASRLSFEPRAYQVVPLLMALRLPVVRLLIADDVGIGKTIEAAMIVRELLDRGEVDSFTVLCPPHLVEQWEEELRTKFDVDAVAVTASSAQRLERALPGSTSIFEAHPFTVVSLDYIKAERRRATFVRSCPKLVIVDEAHTCVGTQSGRQLRYKLLQQLTGDAERHMLLLTATPHSGDEEAFDRLLSLIDKDLNKTYLDSDAGRRRLARHFVQRRRIDITGKDWGEDRAFPEHETAEKTYTLNEAHKAFNESILDYCLGVVEGAGAEENKRRLAFWGTLALMRCVGSSPAAALSTLRNRLANAKDELEEQVLDEDGDDGDALDVEPSSGFAEDADLKKLIATAERLTSEPDPKLTSLVQVLKPLIKEGANPVVFCRFIATAEHVASTLRDTFKKVRVEVVTGALTSDDRRLRVDATEEADQRILVATDCLSEGINLQRLFDTVIHYDLSWNPTRHEQREGRVNRFGQPAPKVRSLLLYSPDSAIDGAVLEVILRKAEAIKKATGVSVPLPEKRDAVAGALMQAVLLRKSDVARRRQTSFDFGFGEAAKQVEVDWKNALEGETRSRARFAQNAIKPEEVATEWRKLRDLLGSPDDVRRFVTRAMARLGATMEVSKVPNVAYLDDLPKPVQERLEGRGLKGKVKVAFEEPAPAGAERAHRTHPLPTILGEALMEAALESDVAPIGGIARAGVWRSAAVDTITTVVLLRLRFKIASRAHKARISLVEEMTAAAFVGAAPTAPAAEGDAALALLTHEATGDVVEAAKRRQLDLALGRLDSLKDELAAFARRRADALSEDHARVRAARADGGASDKVEVLPEPDIVGVYVIVPDGV
ncbi:MAG: helicase-related protein [Caulobacterales bacterium]